MGKKILMGYDGGYGFECRSLFIPRAGWKQVGIDVSGLELRLLAHFMARWDDGEYAKALITSDIHVVNQKAAGLRLRDSAKTMIYALLYGAFDFKLGTIAAEDVGEKWGRNKTLAEGKALRARLMKNLPALEELTKAVSAKAKATGMLTTLDGGILYVRHAHASLNTLLQGNGAVVCKRWMVNVDEAMEAEGIRRGEFPDDPNADYNQLAWVHDELQNEAKPEYAQRLADVSLEQIAFTGEQFNLRCPLSGEAKIGTSWATTH